MKNPRKIQKGSESMNEKDEKKAPQTFSVRTDLAIEARELAQKDTTDTLEGVAVETDEQADYSLHMYTSSLLREARAWVSRWGIILHWNRKS